jgi:hypothetical protein
MKRFLLPIPLVLLTTLLWADDPAARLRIERDRLSHNSDLIEKLVTHGLNLAQEENTLKRAAECTSLADELATEISGSASLKDPTRTGDLAEELSWVLRDGVKENLSRARDAIPMGSAEEANLNQAKRNAANVMNEVENTLRMTPGWRQDARIQQALKDIQDFQREALKGLPDSAPK